MGLKRSFENSKQFWCITLLLLGMLITAGALRVFAAPSEAPPAALVTVTWNSTVITVDTNATAYTSQNYAYHDIFCSVDITGTQQLTVTVQASPDSSDWFDVYEFPVITADTNFFTRCVSYGRYERIQLDVGYAVAVTPTCKSIFFSNWMPANYLQAK